MGLDRLWKLPLPNHPGTGFLVGDSGSLSGLIIN